MPISRNGNSYRPNPPRRFVGPPAWLAARAAVEAPRPAPGLDPSIPRHSFYGRLDLVKSCDYRRKTDSCGCSRRYLCDLGRGGKREDDQAWGVVSDLDCLDCVAGL